MNGQTKSVLLSMALAVGVAAATWETQRAFNGQDEFLDDMIDGVAVAIALGAAWAQARQLSPAALIRAVNAGDAGVKVVAAGAPVPTIHRPLRGPGSIP